MPTCISGGAKVLKQMQTVLLNVSQTTQLFPHSNGDSDGNKIVTDEAGFAIQQHQKHEEGLMQFINSIEERAASHL